MKNFNTFNLAASILILLGAGSALAQISPRVVDYAERIREISSSDNPEFNAVLDAALKSNISDSRKLSLLHRLRIAQLQLADLSSVKASKEAVESARANVEDAVSEILRQTHTGGLNARTGAQEMTGGINVVKDAIPENSKLKLPDHQIELLKRELSGKELLKGVPSDGSHLSAYLYRVGGSDEWLYVDHNQSGFRVFRGQAGALKEIKVSKVESRAVGSTRIWLETGELVFCPFPLRSKLHAVITPTLGNSKVLEQYFPEEKRDNLDKQVFKTGSYYSVTPLSIEDAKKVVDAPNVVKSLFQTEVNIKEAGGVDDKNSKEDLLAHQTDAKGHDVKKAE